jgi:hypothetical protein
MFGRRGASAPIPAMGTTSATSMLMRTRLNARPRVLRNRHPRALRPRLGMVNVPSCLCAWDLIGAVRSGLPVFEEKCIEHPEGGSGRRAICKARCSDRPGRVRRRMYQRTFNPYQRVRRAGGSACPPGPVAGTRLIDCKLAGSYSRSLSSRRPAATCAVFRGQSGSSIGIPQGPRNVRIDHHRGAARGQCG